MGYSHITGSVIPENFEFYEKLAPPVYDPEKARQLLAEAGHAGGFDAGFYTCEVAYADLGEAALNYLGEVGIRAKLRPLANSLLLAAVAMAFWLLVGIPSGILAAVRVGRFWDSAGKMFALLGLSLPSFLVGLVLILVFSVFLGWLPSSGSGSVLHIGCRGLLL